MATEPAPGGRTILPPETVLRTARRVFLATGSLEMRALARELGIGRATLYRWNRGRDELLSEVLLSLAEANFRRVEADIDTAPPCRVVRGNPRIAKAMTPNARG